jgi:hypothetical protein
MPSPRALGKHLWVNPDSGIAEPLVRRVPNLNFNFVSARMAESVSQSVSLPANPVDLVFEEVALCLTPALLRSRGKQGCRRSKE